MKKRLFLLPVFACALILAACGGLNEEKEPEVTTEAPATTEESDQEAVTDEGRDAKTTQQKDPEQAVGEDEDNRQATQGKAAPGQRELPEPIVLNEQIQHPKGMIFLLEQITFEEDHVLVDFTAENHTGYKQHLASAGEAKGANLGGVTLEDDTGFVYRYIAKNNARISIDDREKVTGTVSLTGRIQDDADSITLIFNPDREFEFAFDNLELVR